MKKEKLIKAIYRKPTIEVYPLINECSILNKSNVNTNVTITPYSVQHEDIDIGDGNTVNITSDNDSISINIISITDN